MAILIGSDFTPASNNTDIVNTVSTKPTSPQDYCKNKGYISL